MMIAKIKLNEAFIYQDRMDENPLCNDHLFLKFPDFPEKTEKLSHDDLKFRFFHPFHFLDQNYTTPGENFFKQWLFLS